MDKRFFHAAAIATLCTTAGYLIAPIEVRFVSGLTDNPVLVGLTFAIGSLFFGILSLLIGRWSDLHGRRRAIKLGCFFAIFYPIMYASTINVFQYMGVRFIWAISAVACGPVLMAYLHDLLKKEKKKGYTIGLVYSTQSIAGAGAQVLGGFVAQRFGFAYPYLLMSVLFVLAFLMTMGLKEDKPRKYEKRGPFFAIQYILKKKTLRFYFIQNAAQTINWGIKAMLWPLIIFSMTGSDAMTGVIFGSMGVVAFFVLPFTGKTIDKIGATKGAVVSITILAFCGSILTLTGNYVVFWVFAACYAIGEALWGPAQAVLLTENVESKYRGEILGADAIFDNILGLLGPLIAGALLLFYSPQGALAYYTLLMGMAALTGFILQSRT